MSTSTVTLTAPDGSAVTVPGIATFPIAQPEAAANDRTQADAARKQAEAAERIAAAAELAAKAGSGTLAQPYPDHDVWLRALVSYKPSAFAEANITLAMAYADAAVAAYKQRFGGGL